MVVQADTLRIGIVEDHALFMDLIAEGLEKYGDLKIVAKADHFAEAKKWFTPEELDVLILDIELPDGNGFGLGVQMRRQNPALGIVMLSSRDVLELLLALPGRTPGVELPHQRGNKIIGLPFLRHPSDGPRGGRHRSFPHGSFAPEIGNRRRITVPAAI